MINKIALWWELNWPIKVVVCFVFVCFIIAVILSEILMLLFPYNVMG